MMTKQNFSIENNQEMLHTSLGKLFYAIAMADKKITPEEIAALKSTILQRWHLAKSSSNGSNLDIQHSILSVFNNLQHIDAESDSCFLEFRVYFLENQHIFNEDLRILVWHTAQTIASSFAKKNKSELVILAKLKMLLLT